MSTSKSIASNDFVESSPKPRLGETSLVQRCVAGDPSAWRALHKHYYPIVCTFLRRLGMGKADLDDAAQEVFLRAFQFLKSFRGDAELQTWLYRLCTTVTSRRHRKRKIQSALLFWLQRDRTLPESAGLTSTPEVERRVVERALNCLSDSERAVFVLYELEGVSGKQIAEIVRCPEATVWRRLHYARRTLRHELERLGVLG